MSGFLRLNENTYKLSKESIEFDKNIIFPNYVNIIFPPGSKIKLSNNSSLKFYGDVNFNGTLENQISLTGSKANNIHFLNNNVNITYTNITNIWKKHDGYHSINGALTFYNTKTRLINLKLKNGFSEDFIINFIL